MCSGHVFPHIHRRQVDHFVQIYFKRSTAFSLVGGSSVFRLLQSANFKRNQETCGVSADMFLCIHAASDSPPPPNTNNQIKTCCLNHYYPISEL